MVFSTGIQSQDFKMVLKAFCHPSLNNQQHLFLVRWILRGMSPDISMARDVPKFVHHRRKQSQASGPSERYAAAGPPLTMGRLGDHSWGWCQDSGMTHHPTAKNWRQVCSHLATSIKFNQLVSTNLWNTWNTVKLLDYTGNIVWSCLILIVGPATLNQLEGLGWKRVRLPAPSRWAPSIRWICPFQQLPEAWQRGQTTFSDDGDPQVTHVWFILLII